MVIEEQVEKKQTGVTQGTIPHYIFRIITKSGKIKWVENYSKTINYEGKPANLVMNLDITDRIVAQEALSESEEKFRMITEQSLLGIGIIQDDVFKFLNKAISQIFEYEIEEMMDWAPNEFSKTIFFEDMEFVLEQTRKKQNGEKDIVINYMFRIITKNDRINLDDFKSVNKECFSFNV